MFKLVGENHPTTIARLTRQSSELYEQYQQLYESDHFAESTIEVGERLMTSLSECRQRKWQNLLETTDMAKNSKKAWSLIRKISNDPSTPTQQQYTTTANQVAYQLLLNGKSTTKQPRPKVDRLQYSQTTGLTEPFSLEELNLEVNLEVADSSPAVVNFSLFIQPLSENVPSQFPLWFFHYMIFIEKKSYPFMVHPLNYCLFPGLYRNLGVIIG